MNSVESGEGGLTFTHDIGVDESEKPARRPIIYHTVYSNEFELLPNTQETLIADTCKLCPALNNLVPNVKSARSEVVEELPIIARCSLGDKSTIMEAFDRETRYLSEDVICPLRQIVKRR